MKKSCVLTLIFLILFSFFVYGLGEETELRLTSSQQTATIDFTATPTGSFTVASETSLRSPEASGRVLGSVSRSADGVRASQAVVLRTASGTISDASGVHVSQDSLSFSSAKNFKSSLLTARGISNGGFSGDTFSADSVNFISTESPFQIAFDNAIQVKFKFTNNILSSASLTYLSKKSFFLRNPFAGNKFVEYDSFADTDGDGLSDAFELKNGLNANSKDSDNDQLSDFDEIMMIPTDPKIPDTYTADALVDDFSFSLLLQRDPSVLGDTATLLQLSNATQDSDGDEISDINEYRYGFDPKNFDSDDDGFADGFELVRGMNALVPDKAVLLASACKDCVFQLSGEANSQLTVDLSGFTGDMPGSKITYSVSKVDISLGSSAPDVFGVSVLNLTTDDVSRTATVTFEKTGQGYRVTASNEIGQTVTGDFSEKLFGDQLDFTLSADDGVLTAVLPSPGAYQYLVTPKQSDYYGFLVDETSSFAQSFEVRRPENLKVYNLFVDKQGLRQSFELYKSVAAEDSGFISLVDHVLQLRGVFDYGRMGFRTGINTWRSGTRNFVEHMRTNDSFFPVIESKHPLNIFTLLLDRTNVFVDGIGQLPLPVERTLLYFAHFGDLGIYELSKDAHSTRLRRWESAGAPSVIRKLETNTQSSKVDVSDNVVRLIHKDDPVQFFVSAQDAQQRIFRDVITKYRIAACDDYLKTPFDELVQQVNDKLASN